MKNAYDKLVEAAERAANEAQSEVSAAHGIRERCREGVAAAQARLNQAEFDLDNATKRRDKVVRIKSQLVKQDDGDGA